jgi:hypothetical protein
MEWTDLLCIELYDVHGMNIRVFFLVSAITLLSSTLLCS